MVNNKFGLFLMSFKTLVTFWVWTILVGKYQAWLLAFGPSTREISAWLRGKSNRVLWNPPGSPNFCGGRAVCSGSIERASVADEPAVLERALADIWACWDVNTLDAELPTRELDVVLHVFCPLESAKSARQESKIKRPEAKN